MKLLEIEYLTNVKVRGTIEVSDEDYENLKAAKAIPHNPLNATNADIFCAIMLISIDGCHCQNLLK